MGSFDLCRTGTKMTALWFLGDLLVMLAGMRQEARFNISNKREVAKGFVDMFNLVINILNSFSCLLLCLGITPIKYLLEHRKLSVRTPRPPVVVPIVLPVPGGSGWAGSLHERWATSRRVSQYCNTGLAGV